MQIDVKEYNPDKSASVWKRYRLCVTNTEVSTSSVCVLNTYV
jgi:hypothetical protein